MPSRIFFENLARSIAILPAVLTGVLALSAPTAAIAWGPDTYYEFRYENLSDAQTKAANIVAQHFKSYLDEVQIGILASNRVPVQIGIGIPVKTGDWYGVKRLQMEIIATLDHPLLCKAGGCPVVILHRRKLTDEWYDVFVGVSSGNGIVERAFPLGGWCIETYNGAQYLQWFNSRLIVAEIDPNRGCPRP